MRFTSWFVFLGLGACDGTSTVDEVSQTPSEVPVALTDAAVPALGDADSLSALTPSPREVVAAMKAAGLSPSIGDLVPDRSLSMDGMNKNLVAVWTGVLAADAVLTNTDASQELFVSRLKAVESGMASLGAGSGLMDTIGDSIVRVENGTSSRDEFLREFEEILAMKVPGEAWGPEDNTGVLVQAGTWLAGVNLVSSAIIAEEKQGAAQVLLRHGDVVDHFLYYVRVEGPSNTPLAGLEVLDASLVQLGLLTKKAELLTLDDARAIQALSQKVFDALVSEGPAPTDSSESAESPE